RELKDSANDAGARDARRRMEELAATEGRALARIDEEDAVAPVTQPGVLPSEVDIGDYVSVSTLGGKTARVVEFRDNDPVILVGSVKMTVPRVSVTRAHPPEVQGRIQIPVRGDLPEVEAQSEIDLRGFRAGEIDDVVMHAVDSAVRADLKSIRIIHGKGTGALRERVSEMLRKESRVSGFRLGAWNEGGAGVTIVEIR
ncbi:MAG: Smr/MutS family protein, partial [Gemmatimonadaceae bacterium]